MNSDELKKIIARIKSDKKALFIMVIGLVGILLIMMSEIGGIDEKEKQSSSSEEHIYAEAELTSEVQKLIENIDGAGKTKVMLTYESYEETVYALDKDESIGSDGKTDTENHHIIIDSGESEDGLKVKILTPQIRGIAVVCQGGSNPVIKEQIITSLSALFNISTNKISVAPMAK